MPKPYRYALNWVSSSGWKRHLKQCGWNPNAVPYDPSRHAYAKICSSCADAYTSWVGAVRGGFARPTPTVNAKTLDRIYTREGGGPVAMGVVLAVLLDALDK